VSGRDNDRLFLVIPVFLAALLGWLPWMGQFLSGGLAFWLTLLIVFVTGVAVSIYASSTFALASRLPGPYVGAVMAGQGLAGVAAGLLRIGTKLALPADARGLRDSTFVC
jgi:hypothetical protein